MNKKIKVSKLVISILICQSVGIIGLLFVAPSIPTWYANLTKPTFTPPNWLFVPVWILLFLLMGISLYLIIDKDLKEKNTKEAVFFFAGQLFLNILWSFLFFGLKAPLLGFMEIIVLWFAILITIIKFSRISKSAALLLIPYILWVSFVAIFNFYLFYYYLRNFNNYF